MKRRTVLLTAAGLLLVAALVLGFRRYQPATLSPAQLSIRQPKAPEFPKDCSELRRALALSTRSVTSGHEKVVEIAAPLDADQTAIYLVLIQQWNSGKPAGLHVSSQTSPLDMTSFSDGTECGCLTGFAVESLLRASHSFHSLAQSDLPAKGIRLVSSAEQNAIVARNDPDMTMRGGRPVNEAVDNAFANGLFVMSEIAFDTERRHALVSYGFHCGMLCGSGATLLFEKVNGQWTKTDRACGGWVS